VHDRFTQSARRVAALADEEARSIGHNYIGTEHLLLGLLGEQEEVAVRVLKVLSIVPYRVWEQVVHIAGGDEAGMGDRRPLTPRARGALGIALWRRGCVSGTTTPAPGTSFWVIRDPRGSQPRSSAGWKRSRRGYVVRWCGL
jgi:hypothetical protein